MKSGKKGVNTYKYATITSQFTHKPSPQHEKKQLRCNVAWKCCKRKEHAICQLVKGEQMKKNVEQMKKNVDLCHKPNPVYFIHRKMS